MKKKIISTMLAIITILAFSLNTYASSAPSFGGAANGSFALSMVSTLDTVKEDGTVIFKVTAKEIDLGQGLTTLSFEFNYNKDVMQPIIKENINILAKDADIRSFDDKTGKITISSKSFIQSNTEIFQVQCKPAEGSTGKNIVLSLKNIKGSNGSTSADAVEISSTVKVGVENIANKDFKGQSDEKIPEPEKNVKPVEPKKPEPVEPKPIEKEKPKEDDTIADKKNANAGIEDAIVPTMIALSSLILLFTYRYVGINNEKIKKASVNLNKMNVKDDPVNIEIK